MLATRLRTLCLAGFALAAALPALADPAKGSGKPVDPAKASVNDVRACLAKNTVGRGALRDLNLEVYDKEGKVRSLRMKLFWKPSAKGGTRVNLRLLEPAAMAGSSYLLLQEGMTEEVYFYLAGADRALRITGQNMSEPLWGTDFSYGEIKQVLGLLSLGETARGKDARVADRPAYALETKTKMDETGYRQVASYVDQQTCVLLKSDFFAKAEAPRKTLTADVSTLLQADVYWTVLGYTMADHARGTRTQLSLSDLSFDERLSEKLFDPKAFFQSPRP